MAKITTGCETSIAWRLWNPSTPWRLPSWKISTSSPKAAASERKFINSDFSGRITDPVITNSTTAVSAHRMITTGSRCEEIVDFWSRNWADGPVTWMLGSRWARIALTRDSVEDASGRSTGSTWKVQ